MGIVVESVLGAKSLEGEAGENDVEHIGQRYQSALSNPPKGGWAKQEQAQIDEVNRLESKETLTLQEQLRLADLKLGVAKAGGSITAPNYNQLKQSFNNLKHSVANCMGVDFGDSVAMHNDMASLQNAGFDISNSPLLRKYEALSTRAVLPAADRFRFYAEYHDEMARSHPEGSEEHLHHAARADTWFRYADYLRVNSPALGAVDLRDFDQLRLSDLDAISSEDLLAQAALYRGAKAEREAHLIEYYKEQGLDDQQIAQALANDPLMNYYEASASLADSTSVDVDVADGVVDGLNAKFDFFSNSEKLNQVFFSDAADAARANGDIEAANEFDSLASAASDREGQVNRVWQSLVEMLTKALADAVK